MWLLLIIILSTIPSQVVVLNTYPTAALCQEARNMVGFEMAEAYPYERDFIIVCLRRYEPIQ